MICTVLGCSNHSDMPFGKRKYVSFYRFPKDEILQNQWIVATGRKNWIPSNNSTICSIHFEKHCYASLPKNILYPEALPTIFYPSGSDDSSSDFQQTTFEEKIPEMKATKMRSFCRLCLSTGDEMEHLYGDNCEHLRRKVIVLGIDIFVNHSDADDFPTSICKLCKSKILTSYQFKKECEKSNEILNNKFFRMADECLDNGKDAVLSTKIKSNIDENIFEKVEFLEMEEVDSSDLIELEIMKNSEDEHKNIDSEKNIEEVKHNIRLHENLGTVIDANKSIGSKSTDSNRNSYTYMCSVCGIRLTNLKTHMRIHTNEKPFKCDFCGKDFRQKNNLKIHLNIHTATKPYKCEECDRSFHDPKSLRSHKIGHTGERPYSCDLCNKSYSYSHALALHRRTHSDERNYICEYCSKKFLTSRMLKIHTRLHTGERPYKCELCTSKFISAEKLSAHRGAVHRNNFEFPCDECGMRFRNEGILEKHKLKLHCM